MDKIRQPSGDNELVDLQFDMTRISDDVVHREIVSIPQRDFELSVKFIRSLIETRFHIPIVCQIRLSLGDFSLDCLEEDLSVFPSRIQKKGERLPITLHYFANCVPLIPVDKMIAEFENSLSQTNYRLIYVILNSLNHEHMDKYGWDSTEAMGTRIYLRDSDFLSKLLDGLNFLNQKLYNTYTAFLQTPEDAEKRGQLSGQADGITMALDSALAFVWNYGAKCMDRIYMHNKTFLTATMDSITIAGHLIASESEEFRGYGKQVFSKCLGVIQGFTELRTPAIEVGQNNGFINLLLKSVLEKAHYDYDPLTDVVQLLIFFSISCQTEVSLQLCHDSTYFHLLNHFSIFPLTRGYNNCDYELFYIGCLVMLNWLKTPNLTNSLPTETLFYDLVRVFKSFVTNIKVEDILKFEDIYKFIWGALDPFTSLFFIPNNSIIGHIRMMNPQGVYFELCNLYYAVALFSLNLLLRRECSRKQILEENLLTHLIIVNWKFSCTPSIYAQLKVSYPEINYFPVPSLYDIAVVQLVCQGQRNYTELIHPIF